MSESQVWKRSVAAGAAVLCLSVAGEVFVSAAPLVASCPIRRASFEQPAMTHLIAGRLAKAVASLFIQRCSL